VFLCRGSDGELRQLANQTALAEMLAGMGFDIIDLATTDALSIARRSLGARIVVGVEGSHLSHALYSMADGGAFLVIQPPDRFALPYKEYADRLGLRFGFVVGSAAETGFTVDLDEMARMLDRLG
jgi:capsular polysaccharide biosynthesis protein